MTHDDRDLREAFGTLKSTRQVAPSVADLTSPSAQSRLRRLRLASRMMVLVAAIAIPSLVVMNSREPAMPDFERFTALTGLDPGEVTWVAPSDVLLDVPGRNLLTDVPLIGVQLPVFPPDSAQPAAQKDSQRRSRS